MSIFNAVELTEDSEYMEDNWTIDAEVREFSNTNVHTPDGKSKVQRGIQNIHYTTNPRTPLYKSACFASVYPNGRDSSTEGQVSLEFDIKPFLHPMSSHSVEMTCTIAVVDKEGCRRFPQSFREEIKRTRRIRRNTFFFDNYISRDFLLRAADELLPEDTLKVQMDGVVKFMREGGKLVSRYSSYADQLPQCVKTEDEVRDGKSTRCHYLLLDSDVGELLRREAKYFERLYATPMAEKNMGRVMIPDEKFETFLWTVYILWPTESTYIFTLQEIFDIYAFADYYGIEIVLETCRRWLKLVCRTSDHASEVFRLADWYNDTLLHGIADGILAMIEKEIDGYDLGRPYPGEPDKEWEYTPHTMSSYVSPSFTFLRRRKFKEDATDISNCYI